MIRKPTPKALSTAIPSRAEVAVALAAAGLLTTSAAHAWPSNPASAPAPTAAATTTEDDSGWLPPATTTATTEEDSGWFPPTTTTATPAEPQGTLQLDNLPPDTQVLVDGVEQPRDTLGQGISLPAGHHKVTLNAPYGAAIGKDVAIEAGAATRVDAASWLYPDGIEPPMGGAPPREHFGGCCARASLVDGSPARGAGAAALAALVIAAFGVRRRRR